MSLTYQQTDNNWKWKGAIKSVPRQVELKWKLMKPNILSCASEAGSPKNRLGSARAPLGQNKGDTNYCKTGYFRMQEKLATFANLSDPQVHKIFLS